MQLYTRQARRKPKRRRKKVFAPRRLGACHTRRLHCQPPISAPTTATPLACSCGNHTHTVIHIYIYIYRWSLIPRNQLPPFRASAVQTRNIRQGRMRNMARRKAPSWWAGLPAKSLNTALTPDSEQLGRSTSQPFGLMDCIQASPSGLIYFSVSRKHDILLFFLV
jgi:hypothetical protein